jgi:DNA-binding MarR family transcriptional regulator
MNDVSNEYRMGLMQLLISAGRSMTTLLDERLLPLDLSAAKFFALYILADTRQQIALSALADLLGTGKSNVTPLIDRMEQDHLVRRVRSEDDRRVVYIEITTAGRERLAQAKAVVAETSALIEADFSPEEVGVMTALLGRFVMRFCPPH